MTTPGKAHLALFVLTATWAAAFPMTKLTVTCFDSNLAVFMRFALAAVIVAPWARRDLRKLNAAKAGIALGVVNQAVYALMALALRHISSSRCALLMSTSVVMVRLLHIMARRRWPTWGEGACTVASAAGLLLMLGRRLQYLEEGDAYGLGAASVFAVNIIMVDRVTQQGCMSSRALVFYQVATTAVIALFITLVNGVGALDVDAVTSVAVWSLLFCAVVATAFAQLLQMHYQRYTSAARAAAIYALEPLLVCVFSTTLFGERLSWQTLLGGMLLFTAALAPALAGLYARFRSPVKAAASATIVSTPQDFAVFKCPDRAE